MQQTKLQLKKIKDFGRVVTGKTPPTKNQEYYGDRYPFITPTDISDSSIYAIPERYLSEEGAQKVASSKLPKNSVCYACIASVGKIAITEEESFTNQQINSIIVDPQKADYRYVFYLLKNITPEIKGMVGGAASPIINKSAFESIDVDVLNLETQKSIADILFAYDQLIENNTRRIKILEEIAQAIYREWFVYPANGNKLPKGWKREKIRDVFEVKYGKNLPTSKIEKSGKYPVYGAGGVIGFYNQQNSDGKVTLVTCRGNGSGTVWRTRGRGFVTNNSLLMMPKTEYKFMDFITIYFMLKNANVASAISGSAQPQITIESLNFVDVILPEESLVKKFQAKAEFMFDLIDSLFTENANLRQARDLLLPKLVTGGIEVKKII